MKTLITFIVLLLAGNTSYAQLSKTFQNGTGNQYKIYFKDGGEVNLAIYVAYSDKESIALEYYLEESQVKSVRLWKYFTLKKAATGPTTILNGYLLLPEMNGVPEIMEAKHWQGQDGLSLNNFLLNNPEQLKKIKVGEEEITIPAGKVKAIHYRHKQANENQQLDFWISDEAKPIGLVKLVSEGKKSDANYSIMLTSMIKNITPTIDPKKAVPLTNKGKAILERAINKI
ncbi:MAG: hypothetical protein WCG27_00505 [Pseudomonadota bacterium]